MTREERIAVLRKFYIKRKVAESMGDGYAICMHTGSERRAGHLLAEEHGLTPAEITELKRGFDMEIEKAGINSDQFRALYNSP